MERAIWRRRFKEEDVTQLLHVKIKQSWGSMEVVFLFFPLSILKTLVDPLRERRILLNDLKMFCSLEKHPMCNLFTCLMMPNDVL